MEHGKDDHKRTEYIRTSKVPKEFDIGRSKLQHWIVSGCIPVFAPDGPGSRTRFVRRSDVETYIKTGRPAEQPIQ